MKIKKNIKLLSVLMLFLLAACESDFLDREPLNQISSASVYQDESLVNAYLANTIGRLPWGICGRSPGYGSYTDMLASATDEARGKSGWVLVNNVIIKGAITPTNDGGIGLWESSYATIRQCNEIIEGLQETSLDEMLAASATAQARYIRAFMYFDLARRYGAVPLITEVQDINSDLATPKTSQVDVFNFVNTELDVIVDALPNKSQVGAANITKQVAIALNARAMLHAQQWSKAAALAEQLISGSYNDGLDLSSSYRELFLSKNGNKEVIFEKEALPPITGHSFAYYNYPVRWRTDWGGQTDPTQELVDDYEMIDGSKFDWNNPAHAANPYENRDPRFYASIFYHGCQFEVEPSKGEPFLDFEWNNGYEGFGDAGKFNGAASVTNYLVKKFANPEEGFAPKAEQSVTSWKEFRFAEILLIYAEAANEAEASPSAKVYSAVNRIRQRAGIPDLPAGLSKDQMREKIRHERKIELVFENHRWFDLIRWGIAKEVLDGFEPHGIKITRKADAPDKTQMPQLFDPQYLNFEVFTVVGRNQTFPDSYYLMPIPQSELEKNPNLLPQNPGY